MEREEHKNWWGKPILKKDGHTDAVVNMAFSPDGQLLTSSALDNTVRFWRVEDGALLRTLEVPTDLVHSLAFSPDLRLLAIGRRDNTTVRLLRVEDGALLRTLEGHTDWVNSVAHVQGRCGNI
jgi:WD40 repeat protein